MELRRRRGEGTVARGRLRAVGRLRSLGGVVVLLACLEALARAGGELVNLNDELVNFQLGWQPWKKFNYSVPSAVEWCAEPHCLECSQPVEWEEEAYETCRMLPADPSVNGTATSSSPEKIVLEVGSSLFKFHGLLICSAAPHAQLTKEGVSVDQIVEGGTLSSSAAQVVVHPRAAESGAPAFLQGSPATASGEGGPVGVTYDAVQVATLRDFLANDESFAAAADYARYDLLYAWPATAAFAQHLVRPSSPNCLLLSSPTWAPRTRYTITLTFSPPTASTPGGGRGLLGAHPMWVAPLVYEIFDEPPATDDKVVGDAAAASSGSSSSTTTSTAAPAPRSKRSSLSLDPSDSALPSFTPDAPWLVMSVRGTKRGAVCSQPPFVNSSGNASGWGCLPGEVMSARSPECVACPLLAQELQAGSCAPPSNASLPQPPLTPPPAPWRHMWTNAGGGVGAPGGGPSATSGECCVGSSFPQLIGTHGCGAPISPHPADTDLLAGNYLTELPKRLCERFGYYRRVFEESFCPLECAQGGNVLSELCECTIQVRENASHINDAYMAGAFLQDLLWQGRALWDRHAVRRAGRLARDRQLDRDARRAEFPTRQRGLEGRWVHGSGGEGGRETFEDAYNLFVDFKRSEENRQQQQHDEKARVSEFDTLYYAALNVRLAGLLLADPLLSPAPLVCPGLFDPASIPAVDPEAEPAMAARLLYPHRDPYWPTYGHPTDEF